MISRIALSACLLALSGCGGESKPVNRSAETGEEAIVDRDAVLAALGAHVRARRASGSFRGLEREWLVGDGGWDREDLQLLDRVLHEERLARRLLQQAMGENRWSLDEAEQQPVGKEWEAKANLVKQIAEAFEAGNPERAMELVREAPAKGE
ncbi:MAG: hypothetical protein ACYTG4_01990 [Planctomycetota bacterium]